MPLVALTRERQRHLLATWRGQVRAPTCDLERSVAARPVALTGQGEQVIPGMFRKLEEGPKTFS